MLQFHAAGQQYAEQPLDGCTRISGCAAAQDDTKETTFEVSVAGEVLKEMLEVRFGRSLMAGALLVEAQEREVGRLS